MFKSDLKPDEQGLNIIIVGCGKVGSTITERLYAEGHDITVIDKSPARIGALTDAYDIMGIVGNGASYSTQMEAGVENADLIIAVTDSDELNLLCCTVAQRVTNCDAIARVRNPDYAEEIDYLREKLGLSIIINPELEAANEIARILYLPTALSVSPFARGRAEMIRFKLPADNMLCDRRLMDLGSLVKNIRFCAIERGENVYTPDGHFILKAGDTVSFISTARNAANFFEKCGMKTHRVKDTIIIGGGKSAYYLGRQLISMGIEVKIIEKERDRCLELESLLPEAIIINGDGSDEELLKEEGIRSCESFVPLTGLDEENILLTLYAREQSQAKVITKINRITFRNVISSLDLGSVVYPKYITAEAIIAYVRAKKNSLGSSIETLYHPFDNRVEAIEFNVSEDIENLTNVPLKDLKSKDELIVAYINRGGQSIIPGGLDFIKKGDNVVIVTKHTGFHDISDILA